MKNPGIIPVLHHFIVFLFSQLIFTLISGLEYKLIITSDYLLPLYLMITLAEFINNQVTDYYLGDSIKTICPQCFSPALYKYPNKIQCRECSHILVIVRSKYSRTVTLDHR